MQATKILEEKYGKKIEEWTMDDFNIISQNSEIADLFTVEVCRENAARTDLPSGLRKIFVGYILIIAFKDSGDILNDMLIECQKKYEKDENPISKTLEHLLEIFNDTSEDMSDYLRLRAINTYLAFYTTQEDADNKSVAKEYKNRITELTEGLIEDIEFMGIRTFPLYIFQYLDLLYTTGSFYFQVHGEDILESFKERTLMIDKEMDEFSKEMENVLLNNDEFVEAINNIDPESIGLTDIDFEDKKENE